jgi:hypothetical protein
VTAAAPPVDLSHAVRRARWALVQTGLIASGPALFDDYVLSNRINNVELMQWHAR